MKNMEAKKTGIMDRRGFLSGTLLAGATVAGFKSLEESILQAAMESGEIKADKPAVQGAMPMGKLGKLQVSRLISGGNLLSGWCHQRDMLFVSQLAQAYLTETKQFDTLELLEHMGINTMVIDMMQLDIVAKYKKQRGGKIQTIVGTRQDWGRLERTKVGQAQNADRQSDLSRGG